MAQPAKLPRGITSYRGRYRVRLNHDGRTHALGMFDTLTDARAALDIAKGDAARGRFVPPVERRAVRQAEEAKAVAQAVTLEQWSQTWLAGLDADPDRSRGTVVSYRSVLNNHILPDLGETRLAELTTERVAEHLAALARRPSQRHPGARVNGIAPPSDPARAPTVQRQGERDHPAQGGQRQEHRAARSTAARPWRASADLHPVKAHRPGARGSPGQGLPDRARSGLEGCSRRGGTARLPLHNLRHTGLSKYAEQGATLAELLHRGGHTDVTVALRYQHATAERDRALTERLSREIEA